MPRRSVWQASEVFRDRRPLLYVLIGAVVWIAVVLAWATRPQSDIVATGLDASQDPSVQVSTRVQCSTILTSRARPNTPLPTLTPQPKGSPALFYRHSPCVRWHNQGRILLLLDSVVVVAIVGSVAAVSRRRPIATDT